MFKRKSQDLQWTKHTVAAEVDIEQFYQLWSQLQIQPSLILGISSDSIYPLLGLAIQSLQNLVEFRQHLFFSKTFMQKWNMLTMYFLN